MKRIVAATAIVAATMGQAFAQHDHGKDGPAAPAAKDGAMKHDMHGKDGMHRKGGMHQDRMHEKPMRGKPGQGAKKQEKSDEHKH